MCGIVGIVSLENKPVDVGCLVRMNRAIAHRGPDDEGYLVARANGGIQSFAGEGSPADVRARMPLVDEHRAGPASVALGHCRFSIIDLSSNAHQPYVDEESGFALSFNGEIYNYLEVRRELENLGVGFRSRSDTEVFLEAWKKWGNDCFSHFNGFWAAALYDARTGKVTLCRDRLGKKPLFWSRVNDTLYFASEIKALLTVPAIARQARLNEQVAWQWLVYERKNLDTDSFFTGIQSLPAASHAQIDARFPDNTTHWWSLPRGRLGANDISADEAARELRHRLDEAVALRLRADVPVAVELSGGMDSSAIAVAGARQSRSRLTSYTVRYPEPAWNEEPYAREVAAGLDLDYQVLDLPLADFWSHIGVITHLQEEPYHSPNLYTNQMIWSRMRAAGCKVSLNGGGGDEVLAGYGRYYAPAQLERLTHGDLEGYVGNALHYSEHSRRLFALVEPLARLCWRTLDERIAIPLFKRKRRVLKNLARRPNAFTARLLDAVLRSDMTRTQMPYWLCAGDRNNMGIPVEVRAPFLDFALVEFAFTLPSEYLLRDGWHKWILRRAMQGDMPDSVLWRRQKLGFPFPYDRFRRENQAVFDLILDRSDNPYVDVTQRDAVQGTWRVMSFLLWYEYYMNRNHDLFRAIEAMCQASAAEGFMRPDYFRTCAEG